jgi:hypothetical protein
MVPAHEEAVMTDERPGVVRDPIPENVPDGQYRRPGEDVRELPHDPVDEEGGSLDLPDEARDPDLLPEPAF